MKVTKMNVKKFSTDNDAFFLFNEENNIALFFEEGDYIALLFDIDARKIRELTLILDCITDLELRKDFCNNYYGINEDDELFDIPQWSSWFERLYELNFLNGTQIDYTDEYSLEQALIEFIN